MQPTDTLPDEFARFLAVKNHRITDLTVPAAIDAMLAFYAEVRMEGCDMAHDGDMLLYQWGTYDWGRGRHFELEAIAPFGPLAVGSHLRGARPAPRAYAATTVSRSLASPSSRDLRLRGHEPTGTVENL